MGNVLNVPQVLKSYEGLVGCQYPEYGVWLTLPNMSVMTEPLLGVQDICLHQALHYSEHDPCYMPQPFNELTLHLLCIPFPGTEHTTIVWSLPSKESFEAELGHQLSQNPLSHLPNMFMDQLSDTYGLMVLHLTVHSSGPDAPSPVSINSDSKVKEYQACFHYLLSQLNSPAMYSEAIMTWQIAQWILLELDVCITWLQDIAPKFSGPHSAWEVPLLLPVIRTLTDRCNIADNCYCVSHTLVNYILHFSTFLQCGIPVWYLHSLPISPSIHVIEWLDSTPQQPLPPLTSFNDNIPAYPVIYSGKIASLECY